MATLTDKFITIAEAASQADRSKTVIRRWILEGWLSQDDVYTTPGRNGAWLIDRFAFEKALPGLLEEMGKRKGGRGHKATDALGRLRGA